jgi:hypothetical protein
MRKYLIVLGFWDAILPNGIFPGRGNRLCGGGKGAMKTDEVCGRPLDPFGYCSAMRAEMQAEEKNPRKTAKKFKNQ